MTMKILLSLSLSLVIAPRVATAANPETHHAVDPDDAYKNNCMRCHTALPQYSSRMNKTIMMHMRLAANLPGNEAQAILEYLNGTPAPPAKAAQKLTDPPR
jgi:hypothetical protein